VTGVQTCALPISAVLGVVVSDTMFHRSLNLVGAGISAIADTTYSPLVALAAFLVLGERLRSPQLLGIALVIAAIVLASQAAPPPGTSRRDLLAGIAWAVAAMATLAVAVVAAKPVLTRAPLLWAVTFRQVVSLAVLLPLALASPRRRELLSALRPRADWRFTLPGTLLGSYLALVLWLAGMKLAATGVAAALNQTSTILVLVLASLLLGEPFTPRRLAAATLAVVGILVVTLG
jgi:drug/metabolite transporter (DMT)-like permease